MSVDLRGLTYRVPEVPVQCSFIVRDFPGAHPEFQG